VKYTHCKVCSSDIHCTVNQFSLLHFRTLALVLRRFRPRRAATCFGCVGTGRTGCGSLRLGMCCRRRVVVAFCVAEMTRRCPAAGPPRRVRLSVAVATSRRAGVVAGGVTSGWHRSWRLHAAARAGRTRLVGGQQRRIVRREGRPTGSGIWPCERELDRKRRQVVEFPGGRAQKCDGRRPELASWPTSSFSPSVVGSRTRSTRRRQRAPSAGVSSSGRRVRGP